MNWIKVEIEKPPYDKQVLLKFHNKKHGEVIIQGHLEYEPHRLSRASYPVEFWENCGYGECYYDYAGRQIMSLKSKKPKSKVIEWAEIV